MNTRMDVYVSEKRQKAHLKGRHRGSYRTRCGKELTSMQRRRIVPDVTCAKCFPFKAAVRTRKVQR